MLFAKKKEGEVEKLKRQVESLKNIIDYKTERIVDLIDQVRSYDINHQDEINRLEGELLQAQIYNDEKFEGRVMENRVELEKEFSKKTQEAKNELNSEYKNKISGLKSDVAEYRKQNLALTKENFDYRGRYEGSIESNKTLTEQIKSLTALTNKFFDALPQVEAKIKSGDNSVVVNS